MLYSACELVHIGVVSAVEVTELAADLLDKGRAFGAIDVKEVAVCIASDVAHLS